jgi:hypothetical protein
MAVKDDFYINGKIVAETGLRSKNLPSKASLATDENGNLIEGEGGAETDPLSLHLDQTTPQTVINGAPIFNAGLKISDGITFSRQYASMGDKVGYFSGATANYNFDKPIGVNSLGVVNPGNNRPSPGVDLVNRQLGKSDASVTFDWENLKFPTLTTNGLLKVSGSDGTIGVDTNTYLTSIEGTAVLSTGETGGTKFLREDGDGTCSWQTASSSQKDTFGVSANNGASVLPIGVLGYKIMPYACTITGWSISADVSGSIQFDIWKKAGAIPTVSDTIMGGGSTKPYLTSQQLNSSSTVTGWTVSVAAGDVIGFYIDSAVMVKRATLTIYITI